VVELLGDLANFRVVWKEIAGIHKLIMKLSLQLKIAALIIIGTASSLMGSGVPVTPLDFEFQWQDSSGMFSPTYLYITAALGIATDPTSAITDFQITTPNGVWTPGVYTPNVGAPRFSVTWIAGSTLTVSGSAAAPVLTFSAGGDILTTGGNFPSTVTLQTGSISTTFTPVVNDVNASMTGSWMPVLDDDVAPDAASSLGLLAFAGIGLMAARRMTGAKA
jgi:hypothetical protein